MVVIRTYLKKGVKFQLNSLKQLIAISFILVFVPLIILQWQSNTTLSEFADTAGSEPLYAVDVARKVYQLEQLSLDIERSTRQYHVVQKEEVKSLVLSYIQRYLVVLDELCKITEQDSLCSDNLGALAHLENSYSLSETVLNETLLALRSTLDALASQKLSDLDQRLLSRQIQIQGVQSKHIWFTVILVTVSLCFALYSSFKILSPVNKIIKK